MDSQQDKQGELSEMDVPQLDAVILKLEDEVDSLQAFIDHSKEDLWESELLSTLVARELEREYWEIEVQETKKMLEISKNTVNNTVEEVEDNECDVRADTAELQKLEPILTLAKEKEKDAKVEIAIAQKKIEFSLEHKWKLERELLQLKVDRNVLFFKQQKVDMPPYTFLSLNVSRDSDV